MLFYVEGLQVTDAQALPDGTLEVAHAAAAGAGRKAPFSHWRRAAIRAGQCQEPGLTMDSTRDPCSTSVVSSLGRMPNSSMAVATRWMLPSTTGPTG